MMGIAAGHRPHPILQPRRSSRRRRSALQVVLTIVLLLATATTGLATSTAAAAASATNAVDTARVFFVGSQPSGYAILGSNGNQTRQWVSEACRAQLTAAGMPTESVEYRDVLAVPNTSNWLTCDQIESQIVPEEDEPDAGDSGAYRPHFQGPGSDTPGGRGGDVLRVTNLNDSGPGSFRAAVTADEPRIVVFEVSGTIELTSRLVIDDSRLTIAGQSAPSPGITINAKCGIRLEASDVVIQHVRIRRGDYSLCGDLDTVWVRNNAARIVFDHVSLSWGVDGTLDFNAASGPEPTDILVVDSIISETLRCSIYVEIDPTRQCHSRAMLLAPNVDEGSNMTLARNLFAHHSSRYPAVSGGWDVTNVNNVMYNYAPDTARHGPVSYINGPGGSFATTAVNHIAQIGTVAIAGPDTPADTLTIRTQNLYPGSTMYLRDNIGEQMTGSRGDAQWDGVWDSGRRSNADGFRIDTEPSYLRDWNILPSSTTEAQVLENAGARPADRDAIDARVVSDVRRRGGQLIDSQNEIGGLPNLARNNRSLTVPANPHRVVDAAGRTAVEAWLETMAQGVEGTEDPSATDVVLFDFDNRSERFWVHTRDRGASASRAVTQGELRIDLQLADRTNAWSGRNVPVSNWSEHRGLAFDYVGLNNGKRVNVTFHEGVRRERFDFSFVDDVAGPRTLRVPFTEFKRTAHQPPGAPNNGQNLVGVQNLYFQFRGAADGEVVLDNVKLTNQLGG